jgi:hypothetical protein
MNKKSRGLYHAEQLIIDTLKNTRAELTNLILQTEQRILYLTNVMCTSSALSRKTWGDSIATSPASKPSIALLLGANLIPFSSLTNSTWNLLGMLEASTSSKAIITHDATGQLRTYYSMARLTAFRLNLTLRIIAEFPLINEKRLYTLYQPQPFPVAVPNPDLFFEVVPDHDVFLLLAMTESPTLTCLYLNATNVKNCPLPCMPAQASHLPTQCPQLFVLIVYRRFTGGLEPLPQLSADLQGLYTHLPSS